MKLVEVELPLPDPDRWCTLEYAAKHLNRSERTVRRWMADGVLTRYQPRSVSDETAQPMLWVEQVLEVRDALFKAGVLITGAGRRRVHTPDIRHIMLTANTENAPNLNP